MRIPSPSVGPGPRLHLALAAAALLLALLLPLWSTRMEAPQYRNEEALVVQVHAGKVSGDVEGIGILNQYVGVRLPLDTPELSALPWALGGLLVGNLLVLLLPGRFLRAGSWTLFLLIGVALVSGAVLLQYRLYEMGHVRSDAIMEGVPDFTPPILGSAKIANFTVFMALEPGGWALLGALLLSGWVALAPPGGRSGAKALPQRSNLTGESGL